MKSGNQSRRPPQNPGGLSLIDIDPHAVAVALRKQRDALTNPPFTPEEFLENLARAGLAETVKAIRPELLRLGA